MMYEIYAMEDVQDLMHTRIHRAVWHNETARDLYLGGAHLVEPLTRCPDTLFRLTSNSPGKYQNST